MKESLRDPDRKPVRPKNPRHGSHTNAPASYEARKLAADGAAAATWALPVTPQPAVYHSQPPRQFAEKTLRPGNASRSNKKEKTLPPLPTFEQESACVEPLFSNFGLEESTSQPTTPKEADPHRRPSKFTEHIDFATAVPPFSEPYYPEILAPLASPSFAQNPRPAPVAGHQPTQNDINDEKIAQARAALHGKWGSPRPDVQSPQLPASPSWSTFSRGRGDGSRTASWSRFKEFVTEGVRNLSRGSVSGSRAGSISSPQVSRPGTSNSARPSSKDFFSVGTFVKDTVHDLKTSREEKKAAKHQKKLDQISSPYLPGEAPFMIGELHSSQDERFYTPPIGQGSSNLTAVPMSSMPLPLQNPPRRQKKPVDQIPVDVLRDFGLLEPAAPSSTQPKRQDSRKHRDGHARHTKATKTPPISATSIAKFTTGPDAIVTATATMHKPLPSPVPAPLNLGSASTKNGANHYAHIPVPPIPKDDIDIDDDKSRYSVQSSVALQRKGLRKTRYDDFAQGNPWEHKSQTITTAENENTPSSPSTLSSWSSKEVNAQEQEIPQTPPQSLTAETIPRTPRTPKPQLQSQQQRNNSPLSDISSKAMFKASSYAKKIPKRPARPARGDRLTLAGEGRSRDVQQDEGKKLPLIPSMSQSKTQSSSRGEVRNTAFYRDVHGVIREYEVGDSGSMI